MEVMGEAVKTGLRVGQAEAMGGPTRAGGVRGERSGMGREGDVSGHGGEAGVEDTPRDRVGFDWDWRG
jgi:hypothetical protein